MFARLLNHTAAGLAGADDETAQVLKMSALNEEGVMAVRSAACDRLLASRVDLKLKVHSNLCCTAFSITMGSVPAGSRPCGAALC
jgi:hypothetical protein